MTLGARIVAVLALAALLPMAVVLIVPLTQAERRARDETARRVATAGSQASAVLAEERAALRADADRAAAALSGSTADQITLVRGPETAARSVASNLAERFRLDSVEITSTDGALVASSETPSAAPGTALLTERRTVVAERESLTLSVRRVLAEPFAKRVSEMTGETTRLGPLDPGSCPEPRATIPIDASATLCVAVPAANTREIRMEFLRSFAGVAASALVAALVVGGFLASRISRPIRRLAERAEAISRERAHPITLLPEKDETRRLTVAFDQMLDALAASERKRLTAERTAAWEEIARRLAHEIKNPLSPIQLAVENLKRARERSPETFDAALAIESKTILEEVASLRALVDEFARFAQLPRPSVGACDPRAILDKALALYSARIASMSIAVDVRVEEAPGTICADAEQIGRVLKNVIANALDAIEGRQERRITVTIRRRGATVSFVVADTGRGFDAEALRRVFTPYFTTRADRGGTGLGMAISQRIAVEHGGSLHVATGPAGGAVVTLTLPIDGPA